MNTKKKKRVLLGMSGGIDSSVSAALLKEQGYDVIGITMQLVPKGKEKESACCNLDAISDAKRVANSLDIPHYTINIRDDFKHHVIDYFVNEYLIGNTPNPCVECNRHIKFDALQQKANELNADYIATGHYCKISQSSSSNHYTLEKAKDPKKDQSYFLYMLSSEQLKRTLFPLGNYLKSDIRSLAEKFKLINAKKKESQDICFVTSGNYKAFIEEQLSKKQEHGDIVSTSGEILGQHKGLYQYTIGQRKGLNISAEHPLYVLKMDAKKNHVIVGTEDELEHHNFTLNSPHITNIDLLDMSKTYTVKVRYQMAGFAASLTQLPNNALQINATTPLKFIAPGQSCVIYDENTVIGGGIIS